MADPRGKDPVLPISSPTPKQAVPANEAIDAPWASRTLERYHATGSALARGGDGVPFASRRGFPGGEVISSISDSDCFLLADPETGFTVVRGKLLHHHTSASSP